MFTPEQSPSTRQPSAPVDFEALLGGRGLQAVSLASLFLSAAFFFKLAVDHGWIPPEVRVLIGLIAGIALLGSGAAMHRRAPAHRAIVEGVVALGGALCYLSLWAAGPLFDLVPTGIAFGGMTLVTGALTLLAARHRSQLTALYGVIGGLITPALLPHAGEQIVLASYLLALSAGMLKLAQDRDFRLIPTVVFVGSLAYAPQFAIDASTGWTYVHDLALATAFFLEFGAALFLIERRNHSVDQLDLALTTLNITAYIGMLCLDLAGHQLTLAAAMVTLFAILAVASIKTRAGAVAESIYLWSAVVSLTLAIVAFFVNRDYAVMSLGAFAIEACAMYAFAMFRSRGDLRAVGLTSALLATTCGILVLGVQAPTVEMFGQRIGTIAALVVALLGIAAIARTKHDVLGESSSAEAVDSLAITLTHLLVIVGLGEVAYTLPDAFGVTLSQQQLITSVGWIAYAASIFGIALRSGSRRLRWEALTVLALAIGKVVVVDLASIELIDRVAVCFGLGCVTLAVSTIYLRRIRAAQATAEEQA